MVRKLAKWNDYYKLKEHKYSTSIVRIDSNSVYSTTPCIGTREPISDDVIKKQMSIINESGDKYICLYVDDSKKIQRLTQYQTKSTIFIRLKAILVVDQDKNKVQIRDSFAAYSWYKTDDITLNIIIDALKEEGLWTAENSMQ